MVIPALEVGGTHVTAAVVDLSAGRVLEPTRSRRPLDADGPAADVIGTLLEVAAPVVAAAGSHATLGVAIPGPFDYVRGIGRFEGVAKFELLTGLDMGAALRAGLEGMVVRIAFLNDADAFVLGEWAWGAAAGHRRVAGITLGTGVGSGFLDDGRVLLDDPRVPPDGSVHLLMIDGVVGGSMAGSWDLVRPPLLGALRRAEPALAGLAVRRAVHPEDSALIGAAVHALGG